MNKIIAGGFVHHIPHNKARFILQRLYHSCGIYLPAGVEFLLQGKFLEHIAVKQNRHHAHTHLPAGADEPDKSLHISLGIFFILFKGKPNSGGIQIQLFCIPQLPAQADVIRIHMMTEASDMAVIGQRFHFQFPPFQSIQSISLCSPQRAGLFQARLQYTPRRLDIQYKNFVIIEKYLAVHSVDRILSLPVGKHRAKRRLRSLFYPGQDDDCLRFEKPFTPNLKGSCAHGSGHSSLSIL